MHREYLIQLTKNLYGLTVLFPRKEPLRYKMREAAIDIFAGLKIEEQKFFSASDKASVIEDLEVLDSFFEVAKSQRWVKQNDMVAIQEEYAKLKGELTREEADERQLSLIEDLRQDLQGEKNTVSEAEVKSPIVNAEPQKENQGFKMGSMQERQERIMDFLKENGRAQVWQTKQILPEVTKRTLRRDFEHMLKKGLIERTGERNDTYYQVKTLR